MRRRGQRPGSQGGGWYDKCGSPRVLCFPSSASWVGRVVLLDRMLYPISALYILGQGCPTGVTWVSCGGVGGVGFCTALYIGSSDLIKANFALAATFQTMDFRVDGSAAASVCVCAEVKVGSM